MLSVPTDYSTSKGCPAPYLRRIADAGFSHVHWCHQWDTDFIYSDAEIEQIDKWLREYGLRVIDLHASAGVEKSWVSPREYERLAGVELVQNRIRMTAMLGSDVIVMHVRSEPADAEERAAFWTQLFRSLDSVAPWSRDHGVRIALENLFSPTDNFETLSKILSRYGPEYLGLCYDSGHGNLIHGMNYLDTLKDRLISVHLHDNNGVEDQHKLLFSGTIDWERLAQIIAESTYDKCINLETHIDETGIEEEDDFLQRAFQTGMTFSQMVDRRRRMDNLHHG